MRADFGANEWLVDELYEQYLKDKNAVDPAWWDFFEGYKPAEVTQMLKPFAGAASSTEDLIRRALQGTVRPQ